MGANYENAMNVGHVLYLVIIATHVIVMVDLLEKTVKQQVIQRKVLFLSYKKFYLTQQSKVVLLDQTKSRKILLLLLWSSP